MNKLPPYYCIIKHTQNSVLQNIQLENCHSPSILLIINANDNMITYDVDWDGIEDLVNVLNEPRRDLKKKQNTQS